MPAKWVDMKALRRQVSMEDVLAHYELQDTLQRKGKSLVGPCPIHKGTSPSQFSVSLEKNLFNCFEGCGGGNVMDLVIKIEGVDARAAALLLQEWFHLGGKPEQSDTSQSAAPAPAPPPEPKEERVRERKESGIALKRNIPLDFALKNLDAAHPYLDERECELETVQEFGLGFCSKGLMKGRIAIPIHNEHGELIAYAGRWPGDPPEGEGKYKLPPKFHPDLVVFNLHRARLYAREEGKLVVVKGFFECMRRLGYSLYLEQDALIVETVGPQGRVLLQFGESDELSAVCRDDALMRLSRQVYVKSVNWQKKM